MVAAPLLVCVIAVSTIPSGIEEIPMHWNAAGEIDRYGSPYEMFIPSGILAAVNLMLALFYLFNDLLYNQGLVHGVSRKGALVLYKVIAVLIVAITVFMVVLMVSTVI